MVNKNGLTTTVQVQFIYYLIGNVDKSQVNLFTDKC